jgi:hypothetical protein
MICFDVYRNGEKLCRAGGEDIRVLNCMVDYLNLPEGESMSLYVGAHTIPDEAGNRYLKWIEHLDLNEGDEITFRIVRAETADTPTSEKFNAAEWELRRQHDQYLHLKAKFEPTESDVSD